MFPIADCYTLLRKCVKTLQEWGGKKDAHLIRRMHAEVKNNNLHKSPSRYSHVFQDENGEF